MATEVGARRHEQVESGAVIDDATKQTAVARDAKDFPGDAFLTTRRLRLRGLRLADVAALRAMNADADIARALVEPCPTDYVGVAGMVLNANVIHVTRPGLGVWHAADIEGNFVGVFSLMPIEGSDEVELGARLRRTSWGRLYSIEGGRALIEHAFTRLDLPRLIGLCHPDNAAVPPILRRLGFVANGETEHFGNRALRFVIEAGAWRESRAAVHNRIPDETTAAEASDE